MGMRLTDEARHAETAAFPSTNINLSREAAGTPCKRLFDIVIASALLAACSPVLILFGLAVRSQDGGKALFSQSRYGLNGETFSCHKIRSMVPDAKDRLDALLAANAEARSEWAETQKLTNDPRITPLGLFVRKTSIDELPQLWNVIRGDMSLVGPRPIVDSEIVKYGDNFRHYMSVRPGLTGLWQVKGRSDTTYAERVALDVEYVRTRSFWGDVKIMLLTLPAVLRARGAR
jgi:exopolysaccharide production protein ExoY